MGHPLDAASLEFARGLHMFPGHPYARAGLARVAAARGDYTRALERYQALLDGAPTPELAVNVGDLLVRTGDAAGAEAMYVQAEALEREGWESEEPQPAALARMLAERGRDIEEAVRLAEEAARDRSDIFTMDALAWAYYQAGRFSEAQAASVQARRTGTVDTRIRCHGAAIDRAVSEGGGSGARSAQCAFEQWITSACAGSTRSRVRTAEDSDSNTPARELQDRVERHRGAVNRLRSTALPIS